MTPLIERLDAERERYHTLRHPFYLRWSAGELTREQLAVYAGQYRHAVVALADLAARDGDAEHAPNPCLRALDTSDLCAVALHVADLATSVGLATDEDARVLDSAGRPIEGLFACGNDMASMMRGSYPGPGTTLGPGMVFALRAAARLAQ